MSNMPVSSELKNEFIEEMNFDEIDCVAGGAIPIVVAYYSIGIVGTLYVGAQAALASMRLGYAANKQ